MTSHTVESDGSQKKPKKRKCFEYGNYSRYYGYRNSEKFSDPRLNLLKEDWFKDKLVLDIGCNTSHITLAIAKKFSPKIITGIDIDDVLIQSAKQNIKHYIDKRQKANDESVKQTESINFVTGNFVDIADDLHDAARNQYDTILFLSISKWIHLNWGDVGLKRCFRRIHQELKPGGVLVFEPQPWSSYKEKKKVTETTAKHYKEITMKPHQFCAHLIEDVGFDSYTHLNDVVTGSGFDRPIYSFVKKQKLELT